MYLFGSGRQAPKTVKSEKKKTVTTGRPSSHHSHILGNPPPHLSDLSTQHSELGTQNSMAALAGATKMPQYLQRSN